MLRGGGHDGLAAMSRASENHAGPAARGNPGGVPSSGHRTRGAIRATSTRDSEKSVRNELLPLATGSPAANRTDPGANGRSAPRRGRDLLDHLAASLDPTDARAIAAPIALARRAIRAWLTHDGYRPDAASIERVMGVARGETKACEVAGGVRVRTHPAAIRQIIPQGH